MTCENCVHYFVCDVSGGEIYINEQAIRDDCHHFMRADNTVEIRHGEWILKDSNGNGICSVCNRQDQIDKLATYCRFCGAKMDGERREE